MGCSWRSAAPCWGCGCTRRSLSCHPKRVKVSGWVLSTWLPVHPHCFCLFSFASAFLSHFLSSFLVFLFALFSFLLSCLPLPFPLLLSLAFFPGNCVLCGAGCLNALLRELVNEFTLLNNQAITTTSLLRSMCHSDDSTLLGSWLEETDQKDVEEMVGLILDVCYSHFIKQFQMS